MKKTYITLFEGFEEIEALAVIDILRRAEVQLITLSMEQSLKLRSGRGVLVEADELFKNADLSQADYIILPGGSDRLDSFEELKDALRSHHDRGGRIAAICAAPMVLGRLGLLDGRRATCYPGFEKYIEKAEFVAAPVVVDGSFVTANGPASALAFAYTLVEMIKGADAANLLKKQMMYA